MIDKKIDMYHLCLILAPVRNKTGRSSKNFRPVFLKEHSWSPPNGRKIGSHLRIPTSSESSSEMELQGQSVIFVDPFENFYTNVMTQQVIVNTAIGQASVSFCLNCLKSSLCRCGLNCSWFILQFSYNVIYILSISSPSFMETTIFTSTICLI